jgi:HK97 family phage prohead protease
MPLEHLIVPIEWKADDSGDGNTLIGYASTFGNVDLGGDVVVKGAFTKTIENIKTNGIPLLADHFASTSSVLGTIYDATEDTKGLQIKARLSQAPSAQDVAVKLREGHLNKMSIGYESMDDSYDEVNGQKVRLLKEIKLWETSVVVFPMNPKASIERVKSVLNALDPEARRDVLVEAAKADIQSKAPDDPADASVISQALGWLTAIDAIVDEAQESLSAYLGVPNPDDEVEPPKSIPAKGPGESAQGAPTTATEPPEGKEAPPNAGDEPAAAPDEGASGWDRWKSAALLTDDDRADALADDMERARLAARLEASELADQLATPE